MKNNIINSNIDKIKNIGSNNFISDCVFVGDNIKIGNNNTLKNCIIGEGTEILDSYLEDVVIGNFCKIGPFSRIRPNSRIGDNCKIGNFVEIKNSCLGNNVKASHLSYIGDAIIGDNTNIGCGVVFANYNGYEKNVSKIGKDCFIGSNVNIIAPVKIADDTYICAGTTVTKDTLKGNFVIGRVKESSIEKYSYYLKNKKNK